MCEHRSPFLLRSKAESRLPGNPMIAWFGESVLKSFSLSLAMRRFEAVLTMVAMVFALRRFCRVNR